MGDQLLMNLPNIMRIFLLCLHYLGLNHIRVKVVMCDAHNMIKIAMKLLRTYSLVLRKDRLLCVTVILVYHNFQN